VRPDTYRFTTHRDYLSAFIELVIGADEKILLGGHDWGGALAFDWAHHHPDRVRGFAYMEMIDRPILPTDGPSEIAPTFMALRSDKGEEMILDQNTFVEQLLPMLVMRELTESRDGGISQALPEAGISQRHEELGLDHCRNGPAELTITPRRTG
jgi:haloalkane dehalogenase